AVIICLFLVSAACSHKNRAVQLPPPPPQPGLSIGAALPRSSQRAVTWNRQAVWRLDDPPNPEAIAFAAANRGYRLTSIRYLPNTDYGTGFTGANIMRGVFLNGAVPALGFAADIAGSGIPSPSIYDLAP